MPVGKALAEVGSGRALAIRGPAAPVGTALTIASRRPYAPFLTQVIAVAQQAPQTRARRRVAPPEACRAYRSTVNGPARPAFSRAV